MKTLIDFNAEHVLQNERVLLRPLQVSDFVNLLRFSINEPELWQYSLVPVSGAENLANYIQAAINNRA